MFIKLCNLGRDAEVRHTQGGKAVASLALAYSVGYGNNKRTQWLEASLWGERAEKMAPYLTKGTKVLLTADDLVVEVFDKRNGATGAKLTARVVDLEFAGGRQESQGQGRGKGQFSQASQSNLSQNQGVTGHANTKQAPQEPMSDDWENDIPFMRLYPMAGG